MLKTKSLLVGSAMILVLVGIGGGLAAWKYRAIKQAANAPSMIPPEFADTIKAESIAWQPTSRLVGTVVAKRSVTVANEVVGVVADVGFDSGETVKQGQVLIKLDASSELADLAGAEASERLANAAIEVAQANLRARQSDLSLATSMMKRVQNAATSKSVSASDLDRATADLEKAKADVEREQSSLTHARAELDQAKARVLQIKTTLAKKTISAPFNARAGMRTVHPGQYLAEGTSIVGLSEVTDDIFLDFAVPQEYAGRVTPGTVVVAKSQMLGGDSVPIKVVSIDATVNPTTRNVRVRSSVANPGQLLKPGMSIDVEVPIEAPQQYVVVPTTAVRRAAFGDHVFVLVPNPPQASSGPAGGPQTYTAHQRMVTLGQDIGGRVIVQSGLVAGELLASSGSFKLREGATVIPGAPPAATPPTTQTAASASDDSKSSR